jgi:hypothetical protein
MCGSDQQKNRLERHAFGLSSPITGAEGTRVVPASCSLLFFDKKRTRKKAIRLSLS